MKSVGKGWIACIYTALFLVLGGCAEYVAFEVAVATVDAIGNSISGSKTSSSNQPKSDTVDNENLDRFSSWSDASLCSSATYHNKWETRENYLPHVKEARRRGLTCGVVTTSAATNPKKICRSTPTKCSIADLCYFATSGTGSNKTWDAVFSKHVDVAKQRDLTCGVVTTSATTNPRKICRSTPALCSTIDLCHFATRLSGSNKEWDTQYPRHVTLAKEKGLDCSVQIEQKKLCKNDPKKCDAERVCFWATNGPVGNKSWHDAYASHVKEAKQRGLNCNVKSTSSSSSTKRVYNNEIPKIVDRAIERLKRIGKLNPGEVQRLIQKLKKMEPGKLKALNTKCTQAFENLQPSMCEDQLTKLFR